MHFNMRLFLLLLRSFLDCIVCNEYNKHFNFAVKKNVRVAGQRYRETVTDSIVDCARECQSAKNCTAANYRADNRSCYLTSDTCYRSVDDFGWNYLSPPIGMFIISIA